MIRSFFALLLLSFLILSLLIPSLFMAVSFLFSVKYAARFSLHNHFSRIGRIYTVMKSQSNYGTDAIRKKRKKIPPAFSKVNGIF